MAMTLHELLERRFGVNAEEFAAALEDFADRVGPLAVVDVRPVDYLGEAQQSTLRKLGASLQPLRADDLGPIAGLAAAHAEVVSQSTTVTALANRLGVDPSRVRQRIYARSVYAFKHHGGWLIPNFQLEPNSVIPGVEAVVWKLSPTLHPVAASRWFTTPNSDLILEDQVVSPIAWLASGGPPDRVAALAGSIDEL
ncbi:MAG: hypothetical protein ACR2KK_08655 [Acidimicrobiales bacterium]